MEDKRYICEKCQAEFKHQPNYCRHKKKNTCETPSKSSLENKLIQTELENKLIQSELEKKLLEAEMKNMQMEKSKPKCKITFKEFSNSIELTLDDLEKIMTFGYIQGVLNIVIDNLNILDEKPIYCTDVRREIIYIMEESWVKNNKQLFEFVIELRGKIYDVFAKWRIKNPNHLNMHDSSNEEYVNISMYLMHAFTNENVHKIVHQIAKEVKI
jgi:hypothetical protein